MILVTGATGFVGKSLCAELQRRQITCRPASRRPYPGFHAIGDMNEATDWTAALEGISTVIHLAARVHVMRETSSDPIGLFRAANVDATMRLARQAAASGVRRFIFLSSVKVNGEATTPESPFAASDKPKPEDPYGLSKWEAEQSLAALGRETGMEIVIIRPPLVYGPGVKANFASLLGLAKSRLPLPFGRVRNRRSLVFVGNLVDFIILCIDRPQAVGQTFLISDGNDLSVGELLAIISKKMGHNVLLLPVPPSLMTLAAGFLGRKATAQRLLGSLQVDISETRRIMAWTPPFSAEQGLARTVEAFLSHDAER